MLKCMLQVQCSAQIQEYLPKKHPLSLSCLTNEKRLQVHYFTQSSNIIVYFCSLKKKEQERAAQKHHPLNQQHSIKK